MERTRLLNCFYRLFYCFFKISFTFIIWFVFMYCLLLPFVNKLELSWVELIWWVLKDKTLLREWWWWWWQQWPFYKKYLGGCSSTRPNISDHWYHCSMVTHSMVTEYQSSNTKLYYENVVLNFLISCLIHGGLQRGPRGSSPTQNFGWVGHNAFGTTNNRSVCSLILRKISRIGATRHQILRLKCTNSLFAGAPPQTPLGERCPQTS